MGFFKKIKVPFSISCPVDWQCVPKVADANNKTGHIKDVDAN
jgi:hypothetical protein